MRKYNKIMKLCKTKSTATKLNKNSEETMK